MIPATTSRNQECLIYLKALTEMRADAQNRFLNEQRNACDEFRARLDAIEAEYRGTLARYETDYFKRLEDLLLNRAPEEVAG